VLKYLKAAFVYHWNLLAFLGGMGFAAVSGHADVVAPLVLAAETAYLGFLGTHPKFQKYVESEEAKTARESASEKSSDSLRAILKRLPERSRQRYAELLDRCRRLRQIAADLKHPGVANVGESLDSLQNEGLDRLLWMFLRLLFTEFSLARFLHQTSIKEIQADVERLEASLKALDKQASTEHAAKVRRTLEDSLETSRARLANFERARSNYEFVTLEVERLEKKIESLAELAINRQEPDYISSQIDQVASSMHETEKTMNELKFVTGVELIEEPPPALLQETES
jgi:chemotaxis protein histidine kinase CheA